MAVCVPSIPPRATQRAVALDSVFRQTRLPDEVHVALDVDRKGAAATRNRAWRAATTEWVAFLDDDDELYPDHLRLLLENAGRADLVYSWFDVPQAPDPLAVRVNGQLRSPFGVEFGVEQATYIQGEGNFIPVTVLVRRDLLEDADGFPEPRSERWPHRECEDWGLWRELLDLGARFQHVPERTWRWNHHGGNTSGRPDRWR